MDVFVRIDEERRKKAIKQKDITDVCGLKQPAYNNWRSGKSKSYMLYIAQIANVLGCPAQYLLTGNDQTLSKDEMFINKDELFDAYRKADQRIKKAVRLMLYLEG